MARIPQDHQAYLRKRPFVFGCSLTVFPADEIKMLEEKGNWMSALVAGAIQPVTSEQKRFLLVDRDEAEPETLAERAWLRLKGRREFEQGEQATVPPAPPEDYGMIEFDEDRCWW